LIGNIAESDADGLFSLPGGIDADSAGNVYVADANNQRIQKFNSSGVFQRTWGWGVDDGSNAFQVCTSGCQSGISGSGNGQFSGSGSPIDLSVNSAGEVYVTEFNNRDISRFDTAGNFVSKFGYAGVNGQPGQFGPGSGASGVATSADGAVFVGHLAAGFAQVQRWGCPPPPSTPTPTPTPGPVDNDGDGIEDSIDTQPGTFSDDFDEGVTTFGTILDRGGLTVTVTDNPSNGVIISASGTGGPAIILACGGTFIFLDPGQSADVDCGTTTVRAITALSDIEVRQEFSGSIAAQAKLTQGQKVTLSPFLADPGNSTPVLLQVVDVTDPLDPSLDAVLGSCNLSPGQELDITFPGTTAVLFTNVGTGTVACTMDENSFSLGHGDDYLDACPGTAGTVHGCPSNARVKVPLCHQTENGYKLLNIQVNAISSHLSHGDSYDLNLCVTQASAGGSSLAMNLLALLGGVGLVVAARRFGKLKV
jgi:hypothetical protein